MINNIIPLTPLEKFNKQRKQETIIRQFIKNIVNKKYYGQEKPLEDKYVEAQWSMLQKKADITYEIITQPYSDFLENAIKKDSLKLVTLTLQQAAKRRNAAKDALISNKNNEEIALNNDIIKSSDKVINLIKTKLGIKNNIIPKIKITLKDVVKENRLELYSEILKAVPEEEYNILIKKIIKDENFTMMG